jgi:hypothetical protein
MRMCGQIHASTPLPQREEPEVSFGSENDGSQAVINVRGGRKATTLSDQPGTSSFTE